MIRRIVNSKPFLAGVLVVGVGILGFFAVRPAATHAETQPTPPSEHPNGVVRPASASHPALIDPQHYRFPVVLSKAQWKKRLDANQFYILREKGTEPPFSGKYDHNHASGIYYSAATGQPLFSSKDKFDSGTGWPSFTKPINPHAVVLAVDDSHFMHRIEVEDSLSGSHLGHVFNDGPPPTGKRYCIDSGALIFVPTGGTPPKELHPNNGANNAQNPDNLDAKK